MDDVVSFLKKGKLASFAFRGLREMRGVPRFIMSRLIATYGFRKGRFSFGELVRFWLPGRFRPAALQNKLWKFLDDEAKNELAPYLAPDGSLLLYGRPFHHPLFGEEGGGYYYLATLLFEVIVFDQYHVADHLRDGAVVIDAGANIGTFSRFVSHLAKNAETHAFEPAPAMFALLKKNTEGLANVACYPMGLGEAAARKMIHGTTFEDSGLSDAREGKQADIVTLDAFMAEKNIPRVDFIKMDTEGYEGQILAGAGETIKKWKPVIAMSAYHHKGDEKRLKDMVLALSSEYICDLHNESEEDLICYPAPAGKR